MLKSASWGGSAQGGVCYWGGCSQGGCLLPGGVCSGGCPLWGWCLLLGGVCFWGGVCSRGGISQHALRQTPLPPVDRQMPVKILPWSNFVAAGNNRKTGLNVVALVNRFQTSSVKSWNANVCIHASKGPVFTMN